MSEALAIAREVLAAELGCAPELLLEPGVHVLERPEPESVPLRRRYPPRTPSFAAVSFGAGAVLSASPPILEGVRAIFAGSSRDTVFEAPQVSAVTGLLAPHGSLCFGPTPRLVCASDTWRAREAPAGIEIALEVDPPDERRGQIGEGRWPNAVGQPRPERPMRALALAREAGELIGVAGIGQDSERVWQIGIDVTPPAQGRGVAAALTSLLARDALDRGAVPFYSAAPSNVASLRTAGAAGFRLAWTELATYPAQEADGDVR